MAKPRLRILVIEDEMLLAMNIEDMLIELGHEAVETASQLGPALQLAQENNYDMALLDVNLAGSFSFPVARILRDRKIPFLFTTGYGARGMEEEFKSCPILQKPFRKKDLEQAITRLTNQQA